MHPRNPYRDNPPDFAKLAELYPELLGKYLIRSSSGKYHLDWKNPDSQRALTSSLLYHNFSLKVNLPNDRLCPPVPNRLNYLCWLSELFEFEEVTENCTQYESVPILDIGVGASCIYPLLGCRMFGWNFYGSDIDPESLNWANQIILTNNLQDSIKLVAVESSDPLQLSLWRLATQLSKKLKKTSELSAFSSVISKDDQSPLEIDIFKTALIQTIRESLSTARGPIRQFLVSLGGSYLESVIYSESIFRDRPFEMIDTPLLLRASMTNPPFYAREEQIEINPNTVCLGTANEMTTEGGEVGFVLSIMVDSLVLKNRVGWYTSMIGKKSSLRILLRCLRILGVSHIFSTRFMQGRKGKSTVRWGVAWTFRNVTVPQSVQNSMSHKVFGLKKLRRRRDVITETRVLPCADFVSTIDPSELIIMNQLLQCDGGCPHVFNHNALLKWLNDQTPHEFEIPERLMTCSCPNCLLSLTFMRVYRSLVTQPAFSFENVNMSDDGHCKELELIYLSNDKSAELCITIRVLLKGSSKRRRDSTSSEDEEPSKKRTRIGESGNTCWENISNVDTESENEGSDSGFCDEWHQNDYENNEVEHIEFSIHMNPVNQTDELFISSNLRKIFFSTSEVLELDFIRTNRRWRRLLNRNREEK